jgi:hypothetical protein
MYFRSVFSTILLLCLSAGLAAQTALQREQLLILSEELTATHYQEKQQARHLADSLGLPVFKVLDDGTVIELQGFEEGIPLYYTTHNLVGAHTISSSPLWPGGNAGLELTGSGEIVGMWDSGRTRLTHQEFQGRAIQMDNATSLSNHATHVGGTMVAGGVESAARGMAWEATLHAYDWNNDDSQMAQAAANGLRVSQHSYGSVTGWRYNYRGDQRWAWFGNTLVSQTEDYRFGFYNEKAQTWDQISYLSPYYLIVKSAGNDRGNGPNSQPVEHWVMENNNWVLSTTVRQKDGGDDGFDCISTSGTAKNILTVGAVHGIPNGYSQPWGVYMSSFSSWGPTDDGRIKPDLVAKGVGVYSPIASADNDYNTLNGTSMSGPMVSGSIGLLLQHHRNLHGNTPMRASTMKGLLIHTADEAGPFPGPDYMFGWGLMNTKKAALLMSDNAAYGGDLHIREETLQQGQEFLIPVVAKGNEPLQVTISWTDPPGVVQPPLLNSRVRTLVNDLDLRVIGPGQDTLKPYVLNPDVPSNPPLKADNDRDNVEMVHIAQPQAGATYFVSVTHKGSLTDNQQIFSLLVSGNSDGNNPVFFAATPVDDTSIDLNWLPNADDDPVMILFSEQNVFGIPEAGIEYSVGETLPGGGTVIYIGPDTTMTHTGLNPVTRYYYRAFSVTPQQEYSLGRTTSAKTLCSLISLLPFFEDFESSRELPECWGVDDIQGNEQAWEIGTMPFGLPEEQGDYAFINSRVYGEGGLQNAALVSPAFDLSEYTRVTLSFKHYFRQWQATSTAKLDWSYDGGQNWINLHEWAETTANPEVFSVDLPQAGGLAPVVFRWRYTGANSYYWMVDDVEITGETGIYADFDANEMNVFENFPVVFSDASAGGDITSWNWNFGEGAIPAEAAGPGPHEVVYETAGSKTISLLVNDTLEHVKENFISVHPLVFEAPAELLGQVEYQDVKLRWNRPDPPLWLHWDTGVNASGLGTGNPAVFQVAQRFTPEELIAKGVAGKYLTRVAWVPRQAAATYTIKVWVGGHWDQRDPGTLMSVQEPQTFETGQWNTLELNNPVMIDGTQELWIGYHVNTTTGHPAGMDQGRALNESGNLIYWNNAWTTIQDFNIDRNFNIHGYFESLTGPYVKSVALEEVEVSGAGVDPHEVPFTRSIAGDGLPQKATHLNQQALRPELTGYRLYRDAEVIATIDQPWVTRYRDEGLELGSYLYNVEALYQQPEGVSDWSPTLEVGIDGLHPIYSLLLFANPLQGGNVEILNEEPPPYEAGTMVHLRATANEGYVFMEWISNQGPFSALPEYSFEMPEANLTLTALFQSTVSVVELKIPEIRVFPNPVSNILNIESNLPMKRIRVWDITGKEMLDQSGGSERYSFSVAGWKSGIYFVQVVTDEGVNVQRVQVLEQ